MSTNDLLRRCPPVPENESKILIIGAYALAPTLFQDPRFKTLYDSEYQNLEDWNSFVKKYNPIAHNVRSQLSNVMRGIMDLDEKGCDIEPFDEASLNDKENLGSFVLKILMSDQELYSEYIPLILATGRAFLLKKSNKPTRPLLLE
jgi:hypothetical protein